MARFTIKHHDPIVNFENYQLIKKVIGDPKLLTIGESVEKTIACVARDLVQKSHVPELLAPGLFETFLKSLK